MKAALFDLDGVIIDSEGAYTKFWRSLGEEYGQPDTFSLDIKGTTLTDILQRFDESNRDDVVRKIHDYEDCMEYVVFPGVTDFIEELMHRGVKLALVTSSDDVKMSYLAKQHPWLEKMFDAVITGSLVTKSKPDPEGYLLAAEKLGVEPGECYVFEDSFQGVEAGRRAGAKVIGVATTNDYDSLKNKADKVIKNFNGLRVDDILV